MALDVKHLCVNLLFLFVSTVAWGQTCTLGMAPVLLPSAGGYVGVTMGCSLGFAQSYTWSVNGKVGQATQSAVYDHYPANTGVPALTFTYLAVAHFAGGLDIPASAVLTQQGESAVPACLASATIACLQGNRFSVSVLWKDYNGNQSQANVMDFGDTRAGNDESSFWTFDTATNYELSVKVLSRCAHGWGNTYQVLVGALTDKIWKVTVTDLQNQSSWIFENPNQSVLPDPLNNDHIEACP